MEREYLELLTRMLDAVQSLEGKSMHDDGASEALSRLGSLARNAPPHLKETRPSLEWETLEGLGGGGRPAGAVPPLDVLRRIESAILGEFNLGSGKLVYSGRTDMSSVAIFDSSIDGRPARCLYMDGVLSSAEYRDGSPALLYPPLVMRSFRMLKNPRNGLVIGIAGGTMVEVLKGAFPDIRVDGVDIDRGAVAVGKKYFSLKEDGRTSLHIADGREFLCSPGAKEKYDIIVLDAFCGLSPVPSMATKEFVLEAKSSLAKGGVCAVNLIARVERRGYLQYAYDTWRSAFRNVFILPLCREGELFNVVLIATDANAGGFRKQNFGSIYPMRFDKGRIFTDKDNRIRDLSPY